MKNLEVLGLDEKKISSVVSGLNQLLADLHVYYMNLRGLHWNIKGKSFFQLHEEFEKQYNDVASKIDEVAERLLQLDSKPENRFSELLKIATLKEKNDIDAETEAMQLILNTLKVLIASERAVIAAAGEANDEVTVALMDDFLVGQEKAVWMVNACLA
ncbi:DNA polymerase III subunit beta [Prevotella sp. S7-1-8]|uniref:Dps family protein n=1 Tax=Prevotella sp. S7-1-8 TaxID=1284775 RepID=UPI00050F7D33|nr:DNA starvation/stationary phase protection protein [Prevotella sp. S7-1-8]KGF18047.1 DNA polymerase III subunit beta [Prevotella sp. S7-1-8]